MFASYGCCALIVLDCCTLLTSFSKVGSAIFASHRAPYLQCFTNPYSTVMKLSTGSLSACIH